MFNFLNTALLAAAAAALIPFLLHLFSRRRVKVVPFSSIAFLKAMQKRQVRAIKIKQLLLLIIRTLIILAVVMAFARPATRGGYIGSHASVSAVILLDNSASMGLSVKDGRLFDLAVRKAKNVVAQMEQADEIAVITTVGEFSQPQKDRLFGNPASAQDIIDRIRLTDERADLGESYNRTASVLAERQNLNREIYFISDFQENSFDFDKQATPFDGQTLLVDLPGDDIDNTGIVGVDLGNQLIEVGTEFNVMAEIKNRSGTPVGDMLMSLYLDGRRVDQRGLRLKAGETRTESFRMMINDPGFHSGYVSLSDDDLLADNSWHYCFYIPDRFNVLVIGEDNLGSRLYRLALAPEENLRRHWSVHQAHYEQFPSLRLNEYDVLLLADYPLLAAGDIARVKEFVSRGGGVLINLGQKTDSANYNNYLADLTGVRLLSSFPREFSRGGYYRLTDFDYEHQILSIFDAGNQAEFKSYARIKAELTGDVAARIISRWSDGSPAITISSHGRGKVMLFNCDITPDISDFSLHPFFVPFVTRSVEFLSSDFSAHGESETAGSMPTRILRHGFNVRNEYQLELPDKTRRTVTGEYRDNSHFVACARLTQSGVYSIWNGGRESDRFAVNIDPDEGDLYRLDISDLTDYIDNAERLPYSADLAGFISEKRFGRELWQYFLMAALLLLALEMYIARDRGGQSPGGE